MKEGEVCVEQQAVDVHRFSTRYTLCGSIFAIFMLLLISTGHVYNFAQQEPSINEVSHESGSIRDVVPDVAVTISVPDLSEGALLDYMAPEFWWRNITNGFTDRVSNKELMDEVQFGSACELEAGYSCSGSGETRDCTGHSPWPVFCIKDTSKWLQGRFGDDVWTYLQFKLDRCSDGSLSTSLSTLWTTEGSGACATEDAVVTALGAEVGINVWFRFPNEDWKETGGLQPKGAQGMLPAGWTWFIYESVRTEPSRAEEVSLSVSLRHNSATVNTPKGILGGEVQHSWFDFDSYVRFPGGIDPLVQETFFSANLEIASVRRELSVRHSTLMGLLAQISGSWAAAITCGFLAAWACEKVGKGPEDEKERPNFCNVWKEHYNENAEIEIGHGTKEGTAKLQASQIATRT